MALCISCAGAGKYLVNCYKCGGKGTVSCPRCNGAGYVGLAWSHPSSTCFACHGTGKEDCTHCNGTGGEYKVCGLCRGTGSMPDKK